LQYQLNLNLNIIIHKLLLCIILCDPENLNTLHKCDKQQQKNTCTFEAHSRSNRKNKFIDRNKIYKKNKEPYVKKEGMNYG